MGSPLRCNMAFNSDIHHRRSIRLPEYDYSSVGAYFVTVCVQDRLSLLGEITNAAVRLTDAGQMVTGWWLKLPERFPGIAVDEYVVMPNHFHGIVVITRQSDIATDTVGAPPCGCPPLISPPCGCPPLVSTPCISTSKPGDQVKTGRPRRVAPTQSSSAVISSPGGCLPLISTPCATDVKNGRPRGVAPTQSSSTVISSPGGCPPLVSPPSTINGGRPRGVAPTVGDVMNWFKTMTPNAYIKGVKTAGWLAFPGRFWQRNYYERVIRDDVEWDEIRKYIQHNQEHWLHDEVYNA